MLRGNQRVATTLGLLALIGIIIMLAATRFGIGVTPDSTVYLEAARNFANGDGLIVLTEQSNELKPLTHYPPLYPSLLGLIASMGISGESGARWLNAFLLGANLMLVGLAIRKFALRSLALPALGALLTLTAPDLLATHSFALTEPLFIFMTMLGMLCLATYVGSRKRGFLIAASLAIALSMLTRYVGLASLISGAVTLLAINQRSIRRRFTDAIIFGAIACAPLGLWMIRNRFAAGGATDRKLVFHPVRLRQLLEGASTVASWFMVGKVRGPIRPIVFAVELLIVAAVLLFLLRREDVDRGSSSRLPHVLLFFIVVYVGFLIFTASFVDADTVFDRRSLAAAHVAVIILGVWVGKQIYLSSQSRILRVALAVVALAVVTSYGIRSTKWFLQVRNDGQGYSARAWRDSATISRIKTAPEAPIYSNGFDSIYYLARRPARYLPQKFDHLTGLANANFEREIDEMRNELKQHGGALVYFDTLSERSFLPSESELRERLHLRLVATEPDGSIYMLEAQSP